MPQPTSDEPLSRQHVEELYQRGLLTLVFEASQVHRANHDASEIQCASLLSVKTGGCPEDCAYCPQSAHYDTGVESSSLMRVGDVVTAAERAKAGDEALKGAPYHAPRRRLDETLAARKPVLSWIDPDLAEAAE